MSTVARIGEFGIIERVRRQAARSENRATQVVGLGDDAFAGKVAPGRLAVVTKDLLVEGIHFRRDWARPDEIGHKAMAENLSDLAAMGGCRPLWGFIGLALPGNVPVRFVDKLYAGMLKIAKKYGLSIVGGDTVRAPKDIVISVTLIGESNPRSLVSRRGARPGDAIFVTGTFGDSAGGLFLLRKGMARTGKGAKYLVRKHLLPEPRFDAAWPLAATGKLTSMIDSSDGLAASVRFMTEMSGVGARVDLDRVPISKALRDLAGRVRAVDPLQCALNGGEDYELVFTAAHRDEKVLRAAFPRITAVGRITKTKGVSYAAHGKPYAGRTKGYEHFSS